MSIEFNVIKIDVNINIDNALSALRRVLKKIFGRDSAEKNMELIALCEGRDLKAVQALLREKIDINARDEKRRTLLIIASSKGKNKSVNKQNFHLVKLLLECKPDVNAKDNYGNTALIMAARNGNLRIVKELINAGADVNVKNDKGFTALMRAELHKYHKTAQFLRDHGARE
ncbi:MAG: ankyrin repeat domain-containing protein [Synergistaceae bacterium]|nr:ankyrin repeat domain-containing protein [Synergistaceae bacterium]